MLALSDRPIEPVIEKFAEYGVAAALLVPTSTGLKKSIMDAHDALRDFLKTNGVHDFSTQATGPAAKVIVNAKLILEDRAIDIGVSLYRPETKLGDPRIWISRLKQFANAGNLLAFFVVERQLFIANVSDLRVLSADASPRGELLRLLRIWEKTLTPHSARLLDLLRGVAARGWIKSLREGATGVGYTLETSLGISANNNRAPDFHGIEIKASRRGSRGLKPKNRSTLFSKTPDWDRSAYVTAMGALDRFGYRKDGRLQLYCALNNEPNSLGHYLHVVEERQALYSVHRSAEGNEEKVFFWNLKNLQDQLLAKHAETFWVKADVKKEKSGEHFHYVEVEHTKQPLIANVPALFELGHIELDYTISEKISPRMTRSVRDHGYLFKMWPRNFTTLFPKPLIHNLIAE